MKDLQSARDKQHADRPLPTGVLIFGFRPESIAQAAGMIKGDVIVNYRGIGNLTTESLSALTANTKPEGSLIRVAFVRDCQEHSVDLAAGPLGISAMDTSVHSSSEQRRAQYKIESMVQTIQRIYLAYALLACFVVLSRLLNSAGVLDVLQGVLVGIFPGLIYFGLRYRKEWVVTLVLIFSAGSCYRCVVLLVSPADDIKTLLGKVIGLLLLFFFAYNIMFFRRAPVRRLFGDKDTVVF